MENAGIQIYPEDMTSLKDEEGNVILQDGKPLPAIDLWSYCEEFTKHLQQKVNESLIDCPQEMRIYFDYVRKLYRFADDVEKDGWPILMKRIGECSRQFSLSNLQKYMAAAGSHINVFAFYNLCCFINNLVHEQKVVLLKPRICDTLQEIKDLVSITFTNKDGKATTSSNGKLLSMVMDVMKKTSDEHYFEVLSVEEKGNVYTKELLQAEFVFYLSNYMHDKFKINRRNNGILTTREQEVVCFFLQWFGLSSTKVSPSRFRQFKQRFSKAIYKSDIGPMVMVQYVDWKDGKINPLKTELTSIKPGDSIHFPKDLPINIKNTKDLL